MLNHSRILNHNICPENLANFGVQYIGIHAINSLIGNNIVITDASRKVCVYMNYKNQIIKDSNCTNIVKLILEETSKSENLKQAIILVNNLDILPKKKIKIIKDIKKIEDKEEDITIINNITNNIIKQGPTKHTIKI